MASEPLKLRSSMLKIRPASPNDVRLLVSLIRSLATYERRPHKAVVQEEDLLRDGFGAQPKFRALIAHWQEEAAGYATFFYFYSTFAGRPALFLEDLFVLEPFRGHGIGHELLRGWPEWRWRRAASACAGRCSTGTVRRSSFISASATPSSTSVEWQPLTSTHCAGSSAGSDRSEHGKEPRMETASETNSIRLRT